MIEILSNISHWIEGFADSPWAVVILVLNAFTESIINPIPPDPLLIGMSILHQNLALVFAALVTVASVLGAVVGHWLGLRFGRPLVLKFISEKKVDRVERLFQSYGAWIILVAALTPIPYKVFAVTAGVMELDRRTFIAASILGRGARFFLLGGLIFFYGEPIQEFLEAQFEMLTILFSIFLVVALVAGFFLIRWRRSRASEPTPEESPELLPEQSWESD